MNHFHTALRIGSVGYEQAETGTFSGTLFLAWLAAMELEGVALKIERSACAEKDCGKRR
jgi:hypothetical protein